MKLGTMKDAAAGSLADADLVFGYGAREAATARLGSRPRRWRRWARRRRRSTNSIALVKAIVARARSRATTCW